MIKRKNKKLVSLAICLVVFALSVSSCLTRHFYKQDSLPYLLHLDLLVNGEERSYELIHLLNGNEKYYDSEVKLDKFNSRARIEFRFTGSDLNYNSQANGNPQKDFNFGFTFTGENNCFIEGEKYYLSKENDVLMYPRLEAGWLSLYFSDEPGIAFLIVFDCSYSPEERPDYYEDFRHLSGTIKITKDFIGYDGVNYVYDKRGKLLEVRTSNYKGEGLIRKE